MGMSKPVHLLARGAEVEEIVNAAAIAVVDAQETAASVETVEPAECRFSGVRSQVADIKSRFSLQYL